MSRSGTTTAAATAAAAAAATPAESEQIQGSHQRKTSRARHQQRATCSRTPCPIALVSSRSEMCEKALVALKLKYLTISHKYFDDCSRN